ncbi:MAG: hypothetical protein JWP63_355, partial [Candidatus Solibacter sp.]|nr:hypothetical protein [Candidatus Solibacter sp.]
MKHLTLLVALALSPALHGQGTPADYQR